ncbi:MAG: hypothetical protein K0A94_03135 [Desulfuromonadales bacterium]|nr:hypothetical protein [Desulfuromonadales bacterium]
MWLPNRVGIFSSFAEFKKNQKRKITDKKHKKQLFVNESKMNQNTTSMNQLFSGEGRRDRQVPVLL